MKNVLVVVLSAAAVMVAVLVYQRGAEKYLLDVPKGEDCKSLEPLLAVMPKESRIYDAQATYRGCPGGSWPEVRMTYGADDKPSMYTISLIVLDAQSAYLAEQRDDPENMLEGGGSRLELVTTQQNENRRAEADACAEKVLNPPRNKAFHRSRKTINGLDFCFDHEENNRKASRMIWTAMAIRGDVFVKVSAAGPGLPKFNDMQSAIGHLDPVLRLLDGNVIQ